MPCSASLEIARLRAILPKILLSLESGACSPDCSLEFLELIPTEARLVVESLRRESKRLWMILYQVRHNAIAIQNVRWGNDGDCGVTRLANCIEEDCDRAMMPQNV